MWVVPSLVFFQVQSQGKLISLQQEVNVFWPLPYPPHSHLSTLVSLHWRIFCCVSGRLRATRPPHTSAVKDSRIGMALVIPTQLAKMELPRTAASLHRAFSTPEAVALREKSDNRVTFWSSLIENKAVTRTFHFLTF